MSTKEIGEMGLVCYADGSARPTNPGYGGYGLFGYTYKVTAKSKNTKHPIKAALSFSYTGITKEKSDACIEVLKVIEISSAAKGITTTNNVMELCAALRALKIALADDEIKSVRIITDSRYFINNFNDNLKNWAGRGYRKQDGVLVANSEVWKDIQEVSQTLFAKNVGIFTTWIKGHTGDYGNELADTLAVIASNSARIQDGTNDEFVSDIVNSELSYADYKQSYQNKDFVYYFKDLFFTSEKVEDSGHCFLSTTEDELNTGRRTTESIFVLNKGGVPSLINRIKDFYRNLNRGYACTCSAKLMKLENRDILRLCGTVDLKYMLLPAARSSNGYSLVGTDGVFLQENTMEYPFIVNVVKMASTMTRVVEDEDLSSNYFVTDKFMTDGKLIIDNKDKYVDLTEVVSGDINFIQTPLLCLGYDIPSYLTLKKIETEIQGIDVVFVKDPQSSFYTLYSKITTGDREICSINMVNKFLGVAVSK